ncbi:MAG: VCBS repeat-containing protein [Lentisphaeraceae bacterium]|nr:VCBS repeat-containing protein [Lentisphaeraceae bacterium]
MKKALLLALFTFLINSPAEEVKIVTGPHYDEGPTSRYDTPYEVISYNQEIKVPLPGLAYDYKLMDWDKDGLLDLIAILRRGYGLVVYKNIGTAENPLFRSLHENQVLLRDRYLGRGFAYTVNAKDQVTFFCFEYVDKETSKFKKPVRLKAFINTGSREKPTFKKVDVLNSKGAPWLSPEQVVSTPAMDSYDWDGDGKNDLIISVSKRDEFLGKGKRLGGFHKKEDYNPMIAEFWYLRNISDGKDIIFDKPVKLRSNGQIIKAFAYAYPEVEDLDGDGQPELIIGQNKPEMKLYTRAKGSINELQEVGVLQDAGGKDIKTSLAFRAAAGDLNNDGKIDLISSSYFGNNSRYVLWQNTGSKDQQSCWQNRGALSILAKKNTPVHGIGISTVDLVDWDGDGDTDLLLGGEPGVPTIAINSGTEKERKFEAAVGLKWLDGSAVEFYSIEMGQGSMWGPLGWYNGRSTPRAVDWDGDGVLDVISGSMSECLYWLKGEKVDGELRFHKAKFFKSGSKKMYHTQRTQVALTDWDGDKQVDVIGLDKGNVVTVFFGEGNSSIKRTRKLKFTDGKPLVIEGRWGVQRGGRTSLDFADWDGDGFKDILTSNFHLGVFVHLNDGNNRFKPRVKLTEMYTHNAGIKAFDWDGDGELEIVLGGDERRMIEVNKPAHLYYFKKQSLGEK